MRDGRSGTSLVAATIATLAVGIVALAWSGNARPVGDPSAAAKLPYFGFNEASWGTAWQDRALRDAVSAAALAGANTNKLTVRWFDVVGPLGYADEAAWARYRQAYEAMVDAGIRPIVMLVGAPRGVDQPEDPAFAPAGCTAGHASPPSPEYDGPWQDYVARAAEEFPEALAFQIWNEPNAEEYWGGCEVDPARYLELVGLARQALGPEHDIVSAGLNPAVDAPAGVEWTGYLRSLVEGGLFADGRAQFLAVHPYPRPGRCRPTAQDTGSALVEGMIEQVDDAEQLADVGIWVTEVGVTSAAELPDECRALGSAGQAQVLSEIYDSLAADDRVEVALVHQLVDQEVVVEGDPDATTYWSNFGVTENDGPETAFLDRKDAYWCLAGRRGYPSLSSVPCSFEATAP